MADGIPTALIHSVGEYAREQTSTNGVESFWAMLKRGQVGMCHHFSDRQLSRYVNEFAGRHNIRPLDTDERMMATVFSMNRRGLRDLDLICPPHTRQPELLQD